MCFKRKLSLIFFKLFFCLFPLNTHAAYFLGYPIYPYLGLDYQLRDTPFEPGRGANVFESDFQQGQIYLGTRFLDYFGFEITYSKTNIKNKFTQIGQNNLALGAFIQPTGATETFLSQAEYRQYAANVLAFYPIFAHLCRLEWVVSLGLAQMKPKHKAELTHLNNSALTIPQTFTFNKTRTIPRVMSGIQYRLTHNLGVRASVTYEDTSRFRVYTANENYGTTRYIALKNSLVYGLGLFLNTSQI